MFKSIEMRIGLIGINYKKTPVGVRSKVAIGSQQLPEALSGLHDYVRQGIILCTCNRTEIYSITDTDCEASGAEEFLLAHSGLSKSELEPYIYTAADEEAVCHLFRVASGLDSMVIGEYEILGQVKRALLEAEKCGLIDSPLLDLFRAAVKTGRLVRTKTGISRNALSVSSVAVDLAQRVAGDISGCKITVIGAGEAGQQAVRAVKERGASKITVMSRSSRKGTAFAREIQGTWVPLNNLVRELAGSDIVICCSGAPHTILKLKMVEEAMLDRPDHPLVVIDIGVPCNVDSGVKKLRNVFLYNIDDLTGASHANYQQRQDEVDGAEILINSAVEKFIAGWHELKVKPLITALVNKAESVRLAKLNLTLKKTAGLSDTERVHVEMMSKAIVQTLLHEPVKCLKSNHKNGEYLRIVKELFSLDIRN